MCWNFEASLLTGIFSYSIAAYMWLRNTGNDRWQSIILFTFSSIQWTDAIIWYLERKKELQSPLTYNIMHYVIPFIIALEPISSLYGAYYMGNSIDKTDIFFYSIICLYFFHIFSTGASQNNHIITQEGIAYSQVEHNYTSYWIFFLLLIYPILKYTNFATYYAGISLLNGLLLFIAQQKAPAIGSKWCLYANLTAILFLFAPYIIPILQ